MPPVFSDNKKAPMFESIKIAKERIKLIGYKKYKRVPNLPKGEELDLIFPK